MAQRPEEIVPPGSRLTRQLLVDLGRNAMEPPRAGPGLSTSGMVGASSIGAMRRRQIIPQVQANTFPAIIIGATGPIPATYQWIEAMLDDMHTWTIDTDGRNHNTHGEARNFAEIGADSNMTGAYGQDLTSPPELNASNLLIPAQQPVKMTLFETESGEPSPWFEARNSLLIACSQPAQAPPQSGGLLRPRRVQ